MRTNRRNEFLTTGIFLASFCAVGLIVSALCILSRMRLPDNVGRELTQQEVEEVIGRNSPLTGYVRLSANADFPRGRRISKITIHHMAGDLALEALGATFSNRDRRASANYAIDSQGRVALYVEESNRAWTSSSRENDDMAVTIEVANDETGGDWHVSDEAYETLIALCVDICERNAIPELVYTGDAEGTLTLHKMFSKNTECPGPYLEGKMPDIAAAVNGKLSEAHAFR